MPSLLDNNPFSQMSAIDKAKILGSGLMSEAGFFFSNPSAYLEHGDYPDMLRAQLAEKLGTNRSYGSPLDRAMNYGGGYQFGSIPSMTEQSADKMAKAYQLLDYMRAKTPAAEYDAWRDYQENMAGVRDAIAARKRNELLIKEAIARKAAEYGTR